MNAADVVAHLESRFPCVQGPYQAYFRVEGGKAFYVTIGFEDWSEHGGEDNSYLGPRVRGVIRELAYRKRYDSEEEACAAFLLAFDAYAREFEAQPDGDPRKHPVILYWRYDAPHIFWYPDDRALKCRLVLSCAPVVEVGDADYDAARTAELEQRISHGEQP